jgi:hypothetical protein
MVLVPVLGLAHGLGVGHILGLELNRCLGISPNLDLGLGYGVGPILGLDLVLYLDWWSVWHPRVEAGGVNERGGDVCRPQCGPVSFYVLVSDMGWVLVSIIGSVWFPVCVWG